ncbi:hypothetical protein [Dactylosporangium sp. CA-233914]|uniref:hypothetical protein n=1 Tax=Dactylosporangium sp. CA-233914 TaxID=3239934 RepID=UPI003D92948F
MSIAPISPVEQPELARPERVPIWREALFALVVAVVVAGLGAPFGLLWSKLAPHVELVQTQYGPYPIEGEPEGYWADDGWFILMAIGMGIIVALAAWLLLRRYRGPIMLAGLVIGSAAASVLGAWLGNKIGWAHYLDLAEHAPVNTHIFRPVKLRTGVSSLLFGFIPWVRGTMLVQALAAAAVYTGLAGFHASPTLRYDNIPPAYLDPPPAAIPATAYPDAAQPHPGMPAYPAYPTDPGTATYLGNGPAAAAFQDGSGGSAQAAGPYGIGPHEAGPRQQGPGGPHAAPGWGDPTAPPPPPLAPGLSTGSPLWPSPDTHAAPPSPQAEPPRP